MTGRARTALWIGVALFAAVVVALIAVRELGRKPPRVWLEHEGRPVRWERSQLPLWLDVKPSDPGGVDAFAEAAGFWNHVAGAPIVRVGAGPLESDVAGSVVEVEGVPGTDRAHAPPLFDASGRIVGARISIPIAAWAEASPERRRVVAAHEVGHALGLAHAENPDVVMFPSSDPRELRAGAADGAVSASYGGGSPVFD